MTDISIKFHNHVYCRVESDRAIALELSEKYSFLIDNWRFHPKVKARQWDGRIRLFNLKTRLIYTGLIESIKQYCKDTNISFNSDDLYSKNNLSVEYIKEFIQLIPNLPFQPREEQILAVHAALSNKRTIILSPTGSGKSFIAYLICRYLLENTTGSILLIVPRSALVVQMKNDFLKYGMNISDSIGMFDEDQTEFPNKRIVLSTWQALQYFASDKKLKKRQSKYDPSVFEKFTGLIGDECHTFNADALKNISDCLINTEYRVGMSGTLADCKTKEVVLEGIFGKIYQFVTTKELIDNGTLSQLSIKNIVFKYPEQFCKQFYAKKVDYDGEVKFLNQLEIRNKKIVDLALSLKGNTVITFRYVETHGKVIFDLMKKRLEQLGIDRKVYFYSGEVKLSIREEIRQRMEKDKDAIIIGSIGSISTGINIVNLHNIIFSSTTKGKIEVLQSIGRVLRKSNINATLYDITDDIRYKKYINYAYKHFLGRLKMYITEQFDYTTLIVDI